MSRARRSIDLVRTAATERLLLRDSARLKLVGVVAAGLLLPLAYAPFGWFVLAPACYAVLFYAWTNSSPRQAALHGFAFGLASFLAGMYWIFISVHEFGRAPIALAALLTLALVAVLSVFPALAGWAAARWFVTTGPWAWLGVLPAVWVLTEWCRGWVFSGLGWLAAGYSQADSWLIGYAPVGGIYLMSWAVLATAGVLVTLGSGPRRARWAALLAAAAIWVPAKFLSEHRWTQPDSEIVTVALAQGAVSQDLKWQPDQLLPTLELYRDLTTAALGSALILWPEAAIPAAYGQVQRYLDQVDQLSRARGSTVLLGILRENPDTGAIQNALVALGATPQFYVKRHLVPFGEYFPVPQVVRGWLRRLELPYSDIEPGPPAQAPLTVGAQRLGVTICYEDLFGAEQLHYIPAATLLVNVSNDAWFGRSIAPHQHLQIARIRAAEAGRYMLRATNTGVSAIIDPSGRLIARSPQFEPHLLKGAVQGFTGTTPYAWWGNYAVVLAALLVLVGQGAMTKFTMRFAT